MAVPCQTIVNLCRSPTLLLSKNDQAYQYQTQKIIQKTVRVPSSLYSMSLGALNSYQYPSTPLKVNWNQMSDRNVRHVQTNSSHSQGSFYRGSSVKHTQTNCRPGAGTPGGTGVDIKHNSYDRYLNRIKGKKPIRRGYIPPTYGAPIVFNPAFPVYGGKTIKTSIVAGCNDICSDVKTDNKILYNVHLSPKPIETDIVYSVGNKVYANVKSGIYESATIISISQDNLYTVQFNDKTTIVVTYDKIFPYMPCTTCKTCCSSGTSYCKYTTNVCDTYGCYNSELQSDYLDTVDDYTYVISNFNNCNSCFS